MPRILVISHNIFSKSGNMGKTMMEFLKCVPSKDLAQLYFHSEIPTVDCCYRYWRIKDGDMVRSIFDRKARFTSYGKDDIDPTAVKSRTDAGKVGELYQFGRKRTPIIYLMRNAVWKLGIWDTPELHEWIREFDPELIFFACGDYTFSYRIVYQLSKKYQIPVLPWCCDDCYIGRKHDGLIADWNHKQLMKWAKRVMSRAKVLLTISDRMSKDYQKLFDKPTEILRIAGQINPYRKAKEERQGIVYAGNLGVNRITPLLEFAKALKEQQMAGLSMVDVYSAEKNPKTLEKLTEENGIRFHGAVSAKELSGILGQTKYVLHVEAFDRVAKVRTGYSLSTKIGECLGSGACIVAYGPKDISSMEYLNQYHAAAYSENIDALMKEMQRLEMEDDLYQSYLEHAETLLKKHHDKDKNEEIMRNILKKASNPPHM